MNSSHTPITSLSGRLTTFSAVAAAVATLTLTACGPRDSQDPNTLAGGAAATAAPVATTQPLAPVADVVTPAAQVQQTDPVSPVAVAPTYRAPTDVPPVRTAQAQSGYGQPSPIETPAPQHRVDVNRNRIGSVESIEPIRDRPQGSGAGAVIGGVLGAVVGNQFGHSAGRAAMTGIGAVGGAVAGNNIERNHREGVTGYRVNIRLDNGSTRSYERADVANLQVGDRVHLDANSFHRV